MPVLVLMIASLSLMAGTVCTQSGGTQSGLVSAQTNRSLNNAQEDEANRMDWWRDARFGMFIHWGLYAVPAGEWDGKTHHAEWIRTTAKIPIETYDEFRDQFNPVKFDADEWTKMAKDAGMRYIVITSKHHDGFCLFDSNATDFDVMSTPFKRDIMAELATATRARGLEMCFYHSIMDWHHPDYLPRRDWEAASRPQGDADMARYVPYLFGQVRELLTRYGKIGVMWFDGEWEATWNHDYGEALYKLCRFLQPDIIVNNRVDIGRGGMGGMSGEEYFGDFGTPEQQIPSTGLPGVDWETCMTMNGHWGYNAHDKNFKTAEDLIRKLCDIASKGGNFLLNIGPKGDGTFPQESVDRLREIGDWMDINGESIYGTTASPFGLMNWGRCTVKVEETSSRLYLHIFDWPRDGVLTLEGLGSPIVGARLLADADRDIEVLQEEGNATLRIGNRCPDKFNSVLVVDVSGEPIVYRPPRIEAPTETLVNPIQVKITPGSSGLIARYTLDGSDPSLTSPLATAPIHINKTCTLIARSFHEDKPVGVTATRSFTKVAPRPATSQRGELPGLAIEIYGGDWDSLPNFEDMEPVMKETTDDLSLTKVHNREKIGVRFTGFLQVLEDDAYTLALTSDDGSRLYVDGELIVDNDGLHGAETKTGVAPLAAGWHSILVEWFNKSGGAELSVKMGPAGRPLNSIPPSALSRAKE